jgi:pyruvate formate lyase activating enzyme
MDEAYKIARKKLEFVYLGNIASELGKDTVCPQCQTLNVRRSGYFVEKASLTDDGRCGNCGFDLNIVNAS